MVLARCVIAFAVVAALSALSGCSSNGDDNAAVSTAEGVQASAVVIDSFAFNPSTLRARVGDTITVTNRDDAEHTLTAKDASFDTGTLAPGQSATVTLTKAGTLEFLCSLHPSMTGTVVVS